ncbi:hypothetical protein GCM10007973_31750 [Polymorphobacter multimanifer]|nr:hypothetical protein GCM10007973_31750 [Polymorphobacter multimanifer]
MNSHDIWLEPIPSKQVSLPQCVIQTLGANMINLLITLVVVGIILWLINTYIPMDGKIKSIVNIVVVIAVIIYLLRFAGIA